LADLLLDTEYCFTVVAYDRYTNVSAASPALCFAIPSGIDRRPPLLSVLFPTNNTVFFTNLIPVIGTATDSGQGESGVANVTLNGWPATGGTASGAATSEWSLAISLLPGYNPFRVIAQDGSTNQNRATNEFVLIRGIPTNEPPLVRFSRFDAEGFQVGLVGSLASSYPVWASSNLVSWSPLTNLFFDDWVETLIDRDATNYSRRFYRFSAPAPPLDPVTNAPALLLKRTGMPVPTTAPALGDNGYLYTSTGEGVFAIHPQTFDVAWGPSRPSGCSSFPSVVVSIASNGIVFAVGDWNECANGRMVAFAPDNGSELWQATGGGDHPRHVVAVDDALGMAYHGAQPLLLIDYLSPTVLGGVVVNNGGFYIGARGIALDRSGNIYTGVHSGAGGSTAIFSVNVAGDERWIIPVNGEDAPQVAAISDAGFLLLSDAHHLLAWSTSDGSEIWTASHCGNPVIAPDGAIYCNATTNGEIIALTSDGGERWRVQVPGFKNLALDFIDGNGTLYGHGANRLVALNSADGSVCWSFEAQTNIAAQVVVANGGRLFLADLSGNYYILQTEFRHAASSWPVALYGNRRHTMKAADNLPVPGLP
jgi:hypothetical protein